MSDEYLNQEQVLQFLSVSARTLRRYVEQGLITKVKRGQYSSDSVMHLKLAKNQGGTTAVLRQRVSSLTREIKSLTSRITLLETVLTPMGPLIRKDEIDLVGVRQAIKDTISSRRIPFETVKNWSDDLLRFDRDLCRELGLARLSKLTDRLIASGEASPEIARDPYRRIYIDKLRWFSTRLRGYATVTRSRDEV